MTIFKIPAAFAAFFVLLLVGCGPKGANYKTIRGATMGTTYSIVYEDNSGENVQPGIDDLLLEVNNSLSTYIETSVISGVNNSDSVYTVDSHFIRVYRAAEKVYKASEGHFDPTIGPVVNAWGFGYKKGVMPDTATIDSLMQFVGLDKTKLIGSTFYKSKPGIIVDFSAIAKGYGVDCVYELMRKRGFENFMVEIGGEVRVSGQNKEGNPWQIGIETPRVGAEAIFAIAPLNNLSMATSGNYRNYRKVGDKVVVHTINPETGYNATHQLLSASVISKTCMMSDAWATAFMVMGNEKGIELAQKQSDISVYFIYENDKGELAVSKNGANAETIKLAL